jgi:hypothetical protein
MYKKSIIFTMIRLQHNEQKNTQATHQKRRGYRGTLEGLLIEKCTLQDILEHQEDQKNLILADQIFHTDFFLGKASKQIQKRIQSEEDDKGNVVINNFDTRDVMLLLESDILRSFWARGLVALPFPFLSFLRT